MADATCDDLLDWPHTQQPPPQALEPAVRDIYGRGLRVVTLVDLDAYSTGVAPQRAAKTLHERGWLIPMRTSGAERDVVYQHASVAGHSGGEE